ncbi:uncharacterized protein LOC132933332 [Metopolophium dirhodum]|uniref:uncharacterized protein LOC132933332 n=1 Tax=Metopolophium dirhodum TaxID=44670 RepID=UPI00298F92C0|nr:uncharacterized protein LOC132933332 [Metopolophium dirhodum]
MLIAINEDNSLPNLKRTSFQLILKDLQFEYVKKNRNSALLEREDLISWRRNYLLKIKHYRAQNRPIYYLDETWVNAGETHCRTWVDTTVASTRDAHLRGLTTGQKAPPTKFVKTLPLLKPNAIIVMDNASYHSVKKQKIPVRSWRKQAIIDWLENKVYKIKKYHDTYVIDEYAKDNGKLVLRLPPYHCELNPIAWSSVKSYVRTHNTTFKLKDVMELLKKAVEHVSPDMWKNFIEHVKKVEDKFWDLEHITDEITDEKEYDDERHVLTIGTGDTSSSDCDSD